MRTADGVTRWQTRISGRIQRAQHSAAQRDCDAREGVGESDHIQATPIQLLVAYTALVNGGHLLQPRARLETDKAERAPINISPRHRAIITQGMAGGGRGGAARRARLRLLSLCILGETGTQGLPLGSLSHSLVV